jgi:transposase
MRKGIAGLSGLVCTVVDQDPQSGHLFFFMNRRRTLAKILWFDRSGYWMLYKKLTEGQFAIFDQSGGSESSFEVASSDLLLLLEGIDLRRAKRRKNMS